MRYISKKIIGQILYVLLVPILGGCEHDIIEAPDDVIEQVFKSIETNDTYLLRVHLPSTYSTGSLSYPVLYQLDGNTSTGSVINNYERLVSSNQIREIIVITIDYQNVNQRVRDFTPSMHENFVRSGGAENFLRFLRSELVPFINQEYRTDTNFGNTLRGHSLGGLFCAYAIFQINVAEPSFNNFIIESPSWWWDDNYIFDKESSYAQNNTNLNIHAYISVGELESALIKAPFQAMIKQISSRSYTGLDLEFETLKNQTHLDVRDNANGLKEIFKK